MQWVVVVWFLERGKSPIRSGPFPFDQTSTRVAEMMGDFNPDEIFMVQIVSWKKEGRGY
jgi:hypothetical protein